MCRKKYEYKGNGDGSGILTNMDYRDVRVSEDSNGVLNTANSDKKLKNIIVCVCLK